MVSDVDAGQIRQQRIEAMRQAREAKRRAVYPEPCPACFAGVGEPCMTRTGGRSLRHRGRRPSTLGRT